MTAAPRRYHTLDAMRGVAALLVAMFHFGQRIGGSWFPGHLAVDLFFALSGFVIALNYSERLRQGLTVRRFVEARIVRLFPLYALGLTLGLVVQALGLLVGDPRAAAPLALACHAAAGALMLPSPCSATLFPMNDPAWSLFFELLVNVAFALFLWRARAGVIVSVAIAAAVLLGVGVAPPLYFNVGWNWQTVPLGAARATFSFCVGMLIHRVMATRAARPSLLALVPVIALCLLAKATFLGTSAARQLVIVLLGFPVLLVMGVTLEMPRCFQRASGVIGDLSYPIYAIHFPLIALIAPVTGALHLGPLRATFVFLALASILGLFAGIADNRLRKRISRRLGLRRSAPAHLRV